MAWQLETLDPVFVQRARREGVDALGQTVRRVPAKGGEPLRDVLRRARPGEPLILASYSPFRQIGPYREFGPVFLSAEPQADDVPPLDAILSENHGYFAEYAALRAYDAEQTIIAAALLPVEEIRLQLRQWETRDEMVFAMLRFPAHGCYAARLNRSV
ncbi:DUF1203 domain-containing protein [Chromobacterium sinusclupearum]|uniref:DUF1203 domain-containing protein n=1 Tax=Chromobacterium sinusclupearum TaxID=2077146 RepID=A0A2K4MLL8_9NEIS|nr:DUF1203 domain-containing protein [Chromobacterium sinusclupearum]POA97984.1 DUF1203 domain-containing protein [Chromobacterium sinusclupearum]